MSFYWITDPSDPTFWVAISLLAALAIMVWAKAPGLVTKMLDARAEAISKELEEARRLREEAQELLASYQRKQRDAESEAEGIVAQARKEARALRDEAHKDLAARLERRTAMAEARIAQAEAHAAAEVKALAADLAAEAATLLLTARMDKARVSERFKDDLKAIEASLN